MALDARALRAYAPVIVLVVTIAAGWMVFIRPISADESRASTQLASLRQREIALRGEVGRSSPRGIDVDPAATFERQVAAGDAAPALLEHLARLASDARARNLLIETVEPGQTAMSTSQAGPAQAGRDSAQRDPRFALFDVPVSHVPIRIAFDTDYASLGRYLWAFRNLPTTVEIRAVTVGLPPADADDEDNGTRADILRASLTLHAYSRSAAVVQASNTVAR
jgi:hypothetical protein